MAAEGERVLHLKCRSCGWIPPEAVTLGVVEAHVATEHPGQKIDMEVVFVCPHCGTEHPVSAGDVVPTMGILTRILFPTSRSRKQPS